MLVPATVYVYVCPYVYRTRPSPHARLFCDGWPSAPESQEPLVWRSDRGPRRLTDNSSPQPRRLSFVVAQGINSTLQYGRTHVLCSTTWSRLVLAKMGSYKRHHASHSETIKRFNPSSFLLSSTSVPKETKYMHLPSRKPSTNQRREILKCCYLRKKENDLHPSDFATV